MYLSSTNNYFSGYRIILCFLVFMSSFTISCKEDPQLWNLKSDQQVIGDYIENYPEKYSEFTKLIESAGLTALMKIRGPYTLMLPTNDAMFEYYRQMNVASLTEFADTTIRDLAYTHLIKTEITTSDIGLGALREPNALGDYLVTEFRGSGIIINKSSEITNRDIVCANGIIQEIDKVIEPVYDHIYSIVSSNPSFKIFSEGLRLTGLKDTLSIITFPFGTKIARTRFTLLAVPDSIFTRYGINDVSQLIQWCRANDSIAAADPLYQYTENLTSLNNPFYRFMEYHCLTGSYFLSGLSTGIYPILSRDNNISITIAEDYKINFNTETRNYTSFNVPESNFPAKNGALHAISDLLPVTIPSPATITWETTDFFDLKQGDYFGKYYMKWSDGENTFAKIHWQGEFLRYYFKQSQPENLQYDCLSMYGWWSVSVTFPKLMKGKYKVSIFQPSWTDVTTCDAYIDGVKTDYIYTGPKAGGMGGLQQIADVDFPTTAEHTITLRNTSFGGLWWDFVRFEPAN